MMLKLLLIVLCWFLAAALVMPGFSCSREYVTGAEAAKPDNTIHLIAASWLSDEKPPHVDKDPFQSIMEDWMSTIQKETGGRVTFKFYPDGSLIKEADGWTAVKEGYCDIYIVLGVSYPHQFPRTNLWALPDLFPNATVASQVMQRMQDDGEIAEEWKDVKVLWHSATTPADVGSRNILIKTLEDWQGLRVAVVGEPETSTVRALGAIPVEIPKTEQAKALHNGLVDAAWLELNGQLIFKFNEFASYHTICHGGVRTLNYIMNLKAYNNLPPDIKAVFDKNSGMDWTTRTGQLFDASIQKAVEYLDRSEPHTYTPPASEFARWQKVWGTVYASAVQKLEDRGIDGADLFSRMRELSSEYAGQ
jgi:TRAP-type transport system periplasmic protein